MNQYERRVIDAAMLWATDPSMTEDGWQQRKATLVEACTDLQMMQEGEREPDVDPWCDAPVGERYQSSHVSWVVASDGRVYYRDQHADWQETRWTSPHIVRANCKKIGQ